MWDKRIKILAASILIMLSAIGQTHFTKRFSSNNGLLSSDNYMTLQDKDGYLWIGSHNGISKFDGNRFKHYTTEHGLPKNDIWYMRQDNIGRMWIGGYYDGVYYIKDNKMESLPNAPETKALMYSAMVKDTIYFTSMGYESYAYFDGTFHMNMTKDSSHFIHVSDDVSFYIGYKSNDNRVGVKLRNSNEITWRYNIYRKDFFLSGHRQFIKTKRDSILLIGKNGLKMVNPQDEYGVPVSKFESLNPSGEVFVRTGDVNRVYENFEFKRRDPHLEKMLSMTNLTETAWLLKDNEGNLWSTLYRGELVMVPRQSLYVKRYTNIENDNNFRNPTIWNGKVFTNSLLGNLYVLDPWSDEFMRKDKKALEYNMEKEKITSLASSNNSIVAKRSTILDVFDSTGYSSYRFSEKQGLSDSISPPPLTHGGLLVSSDTFLSCGFNKYRLTGNKAVLVEQSGLEISKLSVILNTQYYYISGGIAGLFL